MALKRRIFTTSVAVVLASGLSYAEDKAPEPTTQIKERPADNESEKAKTPAGSGPETSATNAPPVDTKTGGGEEAVGAPPEIAKGEQPIPTEIPGTPSIEPASIIMLSERKSGQNDSSPAWSPNGDMLAFERNTGGKKEIIITRPDGSVVQKIYYTRSQDNQSDILLPGLDLLEETSYNAGITWSPTGGKFVFMSNAGSGNYDLYLMELGGKITTRLTEDKEKDGQAHWSPVGDKLVFVSGKTGKAELYIKELTTGRTEKITSGAKSYFYPQWSPDGKRLAVVYGSNENHDIYLIGDVKKPAETTRALTSWNFDDLRPIWSPDGKKIAFYSNYNERNDPNVWCLIVIASDGSDPDKGEGLASKVVAKNVVPDIESGPAWMPDGNRIVYARSEEKEYNPLYIVNVNDKETVRIKTGTKMNHDITVSPKGNIAFRAQLDQWDRIYAAELDRQAEETVNKGVVNSVGLEEKNLSGSK